MVHCYTLNKGGIPYSIISIKSRVKDIKYCINLQLKINIVSTSQLIRNIVSTPQMKKNIMYAPQLKKSLCQLPNWKKYIVSTPQLKKNIVPTPQLKRHCFNSPIEKKPWWTPWQKNIVSTPQLKKSIVSTPQLKTKNCVNSLTEKASFRNLKSVKIWFPLPHPFYCPPKPSFFLSMLLF